MKQFVCSLALEDTVDATVLPTFEQQLGAGNAVNAESKELVLQEINAGAVGHPIQGQRSGGVFEWSGKYLLIIADATPYQISEALRMAKNSADSGFEADPRPTGSITLPSRPKPQLQPPSPALARSLEPTMPVSRP